MEDHGNTAKTQLTCQLRGTGRWYTSYWIHDQGWDFQACYGDADVYRHPKTRGWVVVTADSIDLRATKYPEQQSQPGWWRMIPSWRTPVDVWIPNTWTPEQETEFLHWLARVEHR